MWFSRAKCSCVFVTSCIATLFTSFEVTEACSLMTSPCTYDVSDLFSLLFGCQAEQPRLKYDRTSGRWVEKCPELNCKHGSNEGDCDVCPTCLLGPGESCSDWSGKCGDDMVCQYSSIFACSGKCVLQSEFKSRKVGDSCSHWEGECSSGLKCRVESNPWSYFRGGVDSGVCVTEEEFNSRLEGESCGGESGLCKGGLTCVCPIYPWDSPKCESLAEEKLDDGDKGTSEIQVFEKTPNLEMGKSDEDNEDITVETTDTEQGENKFESEISKILLESEESAETSFPSILMEEVALIENILESEMVHSNKSNTFDEEETIEVIGLPNDEGTLVITMETNSPNKQEGTEQADQSEDDSTEDVTDDVDVTSSTNVKILVSDGFKELEDEDFLIVEPK